jgi:uncharacterized protein (DUF1697 family)
MRRELTTPANIFVALLRGINVGGKNMIRMSSLKASFEGMGFKDVTTYINSGNVVFKTEESDARKLERDVERMLSGEYGLECKVVVRSFSEMANLLEGLPDNWGGDGRRKYDVMFLRHSIDDGKVPDGLRPKDGIEQVVYRPGALLWSALISDLSRTAVHRLPGRKLFQDMTVRNLNTARRLYEIMKKMSDA